MFYFFLFKIELLFILLVKSRKPKLRFRGLVGDSKFTFKLKIHKTYFIT